MKASEIEQRGKNQKNEADTEVSAVNFLFPQQYFIIYKVKVNQMQSFTGICADLKVLSSEMDPVESRLIR